MHLVVKSALVLLPILLLTACGSGSNNDDKSNAPSVIFDRTSLQLKGSMSKDTLHQVGFTLNDLPDDGIYAKQLSSNHSSIFDSDVEMVSDTRGVISLSFLSGIKSGGAGTLSGTMDIGFCYDEACSKHITGSPVKLILDINYPAVTVQDIPTSYSITMGELKNKNFISKIPIPLNNPDKERLYVKARRLAENNHIDFISDTIDSDNNLNLYVKFYPYSNKYGILKDIIEGFICYDNECKIPVENSEFYIDVTLDHTITDENVEPLKIIQQHPLSFISRDILKLQFLAERNAIAILLDNALFLVQLDDFSYQRVNIARMANSMALSGTEVAIAHLDGQVSYVSFAGAQPTVTIFNSAATRGINIRDIAITENKIHVTGSHFGNTNFFSIDMATDTINSLITDTPYFGRIIAHPTQPWVYALSSEQSPRTIHKIDVSSNPATWLYASPYQVSYEHCSHSPWMSEDGLRSYTHCGDIFNLSADHNLDFRYAGKFILYNELSQISHLAESIPDNEIMLVESDQDFTRISNYDREYLYNRQIRSIPLKVIDNNYYQQVAAAVFYNRDKTKRYMLSYIFKGSSSELHIAEIEF